MDVKIGVEAMTASVEMLEVRVRATVCATCVIIHMQSNFSTPIFALNHMGRSSMSAVPGDTNTDLGGVAASA